MKRIRHTWLWLALLVAAWAPPSDGQTVTTGNISGVVVDQQAAVLPGATVTAVHTPTGTTYDTLTESDGHYNMLNVRVGPYTVTVDLIGFRSDKQENLQVGLGETRSADFKLGLASLTETVQVTAQSPAIDLSRAGSAANISNDVKENLPTITRSLADIVRLSPLFNATGGGAGDGQSVVSVAGTSFRYNSLQIDGAANNDLFGLAGSAGVPGGAAETQPISLDAIQEIQLVVSPYDVRQGGFAGGGINAITKSGTNALRGTVFFFGRNQDWVGNGADDRPVSTFKHKQGGGTMGGPLVRNRAFFFGTADYERRVRPTGISVNGSGQRFGNEALVDRIINDLKTLYGYDPGPGPKGEFTKATDNNKYFIRTDFNVGKDHQLTVRHNFTDALNDVGFPSLSTFRLPDAYYRYVSKTNSTVGQLNSVLGRGVNELRVTYTRVRDHREHAFDQPPFPQVTIVLAGSTTVVAGTENFSGRNQIDQDIVELNEAYTLLRGSHTFTLGSHNEFLKLNNLFIRDAFGSYRFNSVDLFEQGLAQQFDRSFSATSDPLQAAKFSVRQLGFYAGDQWRVKRSLSLTYGLRVDAPTYPRKPNANPIAVAHFGYSTDVVPNDVQWSPRVGFNWDLHGSGREQVRGGIGAFTGRPAYVWISNQFGNTGIDFRRIGASNNANNRIPFVADPANQPTVVTGATGSSFTNEIDVIDPDFTYPSILRGNIGWDRQLRWGLLGTADFVWSRTLQDIKYQNLNLVPVAGVLGSGGRTFFARKVTTLSDVILLENSTRGYNWNLTYEVRRATRSGLFFSGSYSYGAARTIMDGTSDQAASNWGNVYVPGDPNNPPLARSNFDPGSRINLAATYDVPVFRGFKTTASVFYSGQSGRPYTLTTSSDVNGDNRFSNDLLYIPTAADGYVFRNGTASATYQDFIALIDGDQCLSQYIGQIIPRNACRAPWTNTLDGRVNFKLPVRRVQTEITIDALNLINLVDSKSGLFNYMSFGQLSLYAPISSAGNTTVTPTQPLRGYNIATILSPTFRKFLRDDLRSRWQIQLGARLRF